jgi:hypothetical protein
MKILSEKLIADLKERTRQNYILAEKFKMLTLDELNWRTEPGSWTVLECLEHLNYYGNFYLPEIEKRIGESKHSPEDIFKSGIFGNYFANMMLPREKPKKIKAFRNQDPMEKTLNREVIDRFLNQQQKLLELLKKAKRVSLTRTKTPISISKWVKLRLGDTFRVVVYHNERHILQANNVLKTHNAMRE